MNNFALSFNAFLGYYNSMKKSLVILVGVVLIALCVKLPVGLSSLRVLPLFWLINGLLWHGYIVFNPIIIGAIGLIAEGLGGLPLGNFSLLLLLTCWLMELIKTRYVKSSLWVQGAIMISVAIAYSWSLYKLLALSPITLPNYLFWSSVISLACWSIINQMLQAKRYRW